MLLGQGAGYFWTVGTFSAFAFIPLLVILEHRVLGVLVFLFGIFALFVFDSKGNFIYYVLPPCLWFQTRLLRTYGRLSFRKIFAMIAALAIVATGTRLLTIRRGEWSNDSALTLSIIEREYSFEVFAILMQKTPLTGTLDNGSWTLLELKELLPKWVATGKVRVGVEVAAQYLPTDYKYLPDAGFYRFFLFPFYHDAGIVGAVIAAWLFGYIPGVLYQRAIRQVSRRHLSWPLLIYLPIPVFTQHFVNGAFQFGIVLCSISAGMLWLIARVGRAIASPSHLAGVDYRQPHTSTAMALRSR